MEIILHHIKYKQLSFRNIKICNILNINFSIYIYIFDYFDPSLFYNAEQHHCYA